MSEQKSRHLLYTLDISSTKCAGPEEAYDVRNLGVDEVLARLRLLCLLKLELKISGGHLGALIISLMIHSKGASLPGSFTRVMSPGGLMYNREL